MSSQRLPYDQWLATQTADQLRERALKQKAKNLSKAKKVKSTRVSGKTNTRKSTRGQYSKGVFVRGTGPYHLSGGIEGSILGQKYNLGGTSYSHDYDPRNSGTVTGYGEYKVKQNSIMHLLDLGTSPPRVLNTTKGEAVVISHREYLGDLLSGTIPVGSTSTSFSLQEYSVNPGNSLLFPFLGTIAHKFQEYEIRGMLVELKTLSSDYASNLSLGSMFAAADYNSLGIAPISKILLENMEYASSCKPSTSLIMPIECEPRNNSNQHLYVSDDLDYEGGDKRLFDLANVYIGSQGIPTASTPIAEIWITYEIALFKPIVLDISLISSPLLTGRWLGLYADETYPFGDTGEWSTGSSPSYSVSSKTITLPPVSGNYIMTLSWGSSGAKVMLSNPSLDNFVGPAAQLVDFWHSADLQNIYGSTFGAQPSYINANRLCYTACIRVASNSVSSFDVIFPSPSPVPGDSWNVMELVITNYSSSVTAGTIEPSPPLFKRSKKNKSSQITSENNPSPKDSNENIRVGSNQYKKEFIIDALQKQLEQAKNI